LITGVGFTVIVKLPVIPLHPPATGVIVIVETRLVFPLFTAVNELISPVPLDAKPVDVVLFVQLKVVPATFNADEKITGFVNTPLQITWLAIASTVGLGFTVIVNEIGRPGQLLNVGVTVMVPKIAELEVFVVKKEGIVALFPDAPNPIAVFELTHP
jgi:hypothetical protein